MRAKVPKAKQTKTRGVSLYPTIFAYSIKRSCGASLSFSKYVSLLIEHDQESNLLPFILEKRMKAAK